MGPLKVSLPLHNYLNTDEHGNIAVGNERHGNKVDTNEYKS